MFRGSATTTAKNTMQVALWGDLGKFDDEFSYFCKFDELAGVEACPGVDLLPLAESGFVPGERVFGPPQD